MIKFFRKIRQNLLSEGKTTKYFKYAIGEILLIVFGIFIALQLQNWNEKRKQEAQFKVILEQLYNTIKFDTEVFEGEKEFFEYQRELAQNILTHTDSLPFNELVSSLFTITNQSLSYESESQFHVQNLQYNPNNLAQNEVVKEIVNYTNNIKKSYEIDNRLERLLEDNNIAAPIIDFTQDGLGLFKADSSYYSKTDVTNLERMVKSDNLRAILKSLQTKIIYNKFNAQNRNADGLSIMRMIKTYYPEVKIVYSDVGIIGTALNGYDDVGAKSTPMILTDVANSIWELDLFLKKGTVKFRCRDSWTQNWGASRNDASIFPKGGAEQDGPNIPIEIAGDYHITLNLNTNSYEFSLLKKINE